MFLKELTSCDAKFVLEFRYSRLLLTFLYWYRNMSSSHTLANSLLDTSSRFLGRRCAAMQILLSIQGNMDIHDTWLPSLARYLETNWCSFPSLPRKRHQANRKQSRPSLPTDSTGLPWQSHQDPSAHNNSFQNQSM